MWRSSPKPKREEKKRTDVFHIAFLGFLGLMLEVVGVWMLFSWYSSSPGVMDDPRLLVGGILSITGFVVLTRWLAALVKGLVK